MVSFNRGQVCCNAHLVGPGRAELVKQAPLPLLGLGLGLRDLLLEALLLQPALLEVPPQLAGDVGLQCAAQLALADGYIRGHAQAARLSRRLVRDFRLLLAIVLMVNLGNASPNLRTMSGPPSSTRRPEKVSRGVVMHR